MKKAYLTVQGIDDNTLRSMLEDKQIQSLLQWISVKYAFNAVYFGCSHSMPSDLYKRITEPVFSNN